MIDTIKTFEERKKELIALGKKKKTITFEELAEALKGLEIDNDSLDDLYNVFIENNIEVVSSDEEDADGKSKKNKEEVVVLDDAEIKKDMTINDPVRM